MIRTSTTATVLFEGWRRVQAAVSSSTLVAWILAEADRTAAVARHSRIAGIAGWFERIVRASWLYRWLTAEPESDAVVIDLRETATVGPVLTALDRLLVPLARNWRGAQSRTVFERLSDAFLARPVQVVSIVALVAVATNLTLLFLLGASPSSAAIGVRFLVASISLAGTRVSLSTEELTDTRTYELAVALLEPPEPPDDTEQEDS